MGGGEQFDLQQLKQRFDESLYQIIKDSPGVRWFVYFPPYSIAEFVIYHIHGDLDSILKMREHMANRLCSLPNVKLFDFQCAPWITDLNNYMDLRHHSHEYNREILQSIHDGKYAANTETVRDNSQLLKNLSAQYRDSLPQEH